MVKLKNIIAAAALTAALSAGADVVELFSYSLPDGKSGLRTAWRPAPSSQWIPIGNGYNLVNSDFGPWGSYKKMFSPRLIQSASDGRWVCIWQADPEGDVTAVAYSDSLMKWSPQSYFVSSTDIPRNILPKVAITADSAMINGVKVKGFSQKADRKTIENLAAKVAEKERLTKRYEETCAGDSAKYATLAPLKLKMVAHPENPKQITDKLIGIFFEDINYAADGGLYGELVQNRDFEYLPSDNPKAKEKWNALTAWTLSDSSKAKILTDSPIHQNNPNYLRIVPSKGDFILSNDGWDGIRVDKGASYRFSVFARSKKNANLTVELKAPDGKVLAKSNLKVNSPEWKKFTVNMKATTSCPDARLILTPGNTTELDIDMVSLFPTNTFKKRENGLRKDLAQTLADLKPRFVRFPGGCVAHGNGVDNIYDWKGSVGPLESRKPLYNIWNYHQTRGLGYHEYFQFCEDIDAEPLPVVAAGVPCQNSGLRSYHSHDKVTSLGQQNGIPAEDMDAYIQDILDLVEYANGDTSTKWGAQRAANGHPAPFNLKYLGIGNEDMITEVFEHRFKMIYDAVTKKYPDIKVVGTVGPFYEGTDYDEGWRIAEELSIPLVDEHYYVSPGWLVNNRNFYDSYRRGKGATKVYLGEWASHLPGRPSNIETALSEALYLTDLERNGDIVEMTSYAPLLAKEKHTQWRPDLIYFNNTEIKPTPDYYVQKLYGNNAGTTYIPSILTSDNTTDYEVLKRVGVSVVKDSETGDVILKFVNMLPVETTIETDSQSLGLNPGTYKAEILTGDPGERSAKPHASNISLPTATLPPYSFTVVRLGK